jgi:cytochrome c
MWMRSRVPYRTPDLFVLVLILSLSGLAGLGWAQGKYGLGQPPSPQEVRASDITVLPDGTGLPPGQGPAAEGRMVYERRCAECHGQRGEGSEQAPLVGGQGSLATPKPLKTVGSYWPYATTLWDYTNRAMPYDLPGTLTTDQVYAVTAYVLFLNNIVGETDVMDAKTLPAVKMPNRDGFIPDQRPDVGPEGKTPAK